MEIAKLNNYNTSKENAFEGLCTQLFRAWLARKHQSDLTYFSVVNGAGGDGGVEAYARLQNGAIIGLQSKFFTAAFASAQIRQIEKSIRMAKRVRPDLRHYIICLPRKKFSERIGKNGKVSQINEEAKVLKLAAKINTDYAELALLFWFEDQLLSELTENGNEGIRRFWFEKEQISMDILATRFALAKKGWLKERYVPDLHATGRIAEEINQMLLSESYAKKQIEKVEEIRLEIAETIQALDAFDQHNRYFPELKDELQAIGRHLVDQDKCFENFSTRLKQQMFDNQFHTPQDHDLWSTVIKLRALPQVNMLRNVLPKLINGLERMHRIYFLQYWESLKKSLKPHNCVVLGAVGTGKTHALAHYVDQSLEAQKPALIIRAKTTPSSSWGAILRHTLDACLDWSDLEIMNGLETLVYTRVANCAHNDDAPTDANLLKKVLICVDGIDEADNWAGWRERLEECEEWLVKFPQIRFVFTARSYPPQNMDPCGLSDCGDTLTRIDLLGHGDTPLHDLVPEYLKTYNIKGPQFWLRNAFKNALALRLFCEQHKHQDVSGLSQDPVNFTLDRLLDNKVERLENELLEKIPGRFSLADQIIRKTLLSLAEVFRKNIQIEREHLRQLIISALDKLVNPAEAGTVLDLINDHGFLVYKHEERRGLAPIQRNYSVGIQSYMEYLLAYSHAQVIAKDDSLSLPDELSTTDMENVRLLTAVMLFNQHEKLIGQSDLWVKELSPLEIKRLQFRVFNQSPDQKLADRLPQLRDEFSRSTPHERDLMISELILPNLYRNKLNLAVEIVHQTLIGFANTYMRDLFWSGPDDHNLDESSILSSYLEYEQLTFLDAFDGRPLIMAWSLSSIDKSYRAKCRSELTDWAAGDIPGFIKLLELVFFCGDPQIQEDLSTVMLGLAAKFNQQKPDLRLLADWIFKFIFPATKVALINNTVVRYGCNVYIERLYQLGLCSLQELQLAQPPYNPDSDLLELDFTTHPQDSQRDGRFPIQDDLGWYLIKEAYEDFLAYDHGGLDAIGKVFMQPYIDKYQREINQHQFAVAAAIQVFKDLGWTRNTGSARDGGSQFATFEEKYTRLAVHLIQGFLADRLPSKEKSRLTEDYRNLFHLPNPLEFGVGANYLYYIRQRDRWILPEDFAESMTTAEKASQADIEKWAVNEFVPEFEKWLALDNLQLHGEFPVEDKWTTLHFSGHFPEPAGVGRAGLTFNCAFLSIDDFDDFLTFINDPEIDYGPHSIRPDEISARINQGIHQSLVDVIWMKSFQEDHTKRWITNQHSQGFQVTPAITELHESDSKILFIPAQILRDYFRIVSTDTRGFFNTDEELKFLTYRHWENTYTEQNITLVDHKAFQKFLVEKKLVPIWLAEHFRSTLTDSRKKNRDDHFQHCRKWFVWKVGEDYRSKMYHNDYFC
jgi:hypothetical protein